ncbi:MAG: VRR-NUC domain-containing protein [Candidatus Aureabacteria bacterium]|nr:VRR-NUC domain-containing protein [Candidatus Auribacterota bacterium]
MVVAFLPHQIRFATEYGTRKRYPVTGFELNICAECKGEKEEAHPRAAIYGLKGKVERFYWREIIKTYYGYVLDWLQQNSKQVKDIIEFEARFPDIASEFKKKAKKHWQVIDKQSPKYNLKEKTEAEFLSQVRVPTIKIQAEYRQIEKNGQKIGKWINQAGKLVPVEEIATEWYRFKGYMVLGCERRIISTWVGTYLAHSIQDPSDVQVRPTLRNSTKGWTSQNRNNRLISILLPEDFGSAEYYKRREAAIRAGIQRMRTTESLRALFDELLDDGELLRDYLWVNDDKSVEVARIALNILPKDIVIASVEWVIQDFWHRQPGWADLFVYKENDFIFVEVKSPHDELSQEQMNWFQWAIEQTHIPCEICRVEKRKG